MIPPVVRSYLVELNESLVRSLGPSLVGVYLHGSAAMGGWHDTRSDVDLLVVVGTFLSRDEKTRLASAMQSVAAPGAGLECSVVLEPAGRVLTAKPPFELNVATGADAKVVDGAGHHGDSDLVMHYAVCRERGIAISGLPPADVFPVVPRPMLLHAFREELAWGLEHAPAHYAVLNACRAWAYADEAGILSKVEGGAWAIARGIEPELVTVALAAQAGAPATVDPMDARRLVAAASGALSRAIDAEE